MSASNDRQSPPTTGPGVKWNGDTAVLTPSREHIIGVAAMVVFCLIFAGFRFEWFFWVPLLPLIFLFWVLYVRTTVGPRGITTRCLVRKNESMDWDEFSAVQFDRKGRGYAVSHDEEGATRRRFWLPGVTFNSLITLSHASSGRIPDPVTQGRDATDQKVQVVHKDGYAVLMDKDEYADYEAQRRAEEEKSD